MRRAATLVLALLVLCAPVAAKQMKPHRPPAHDGPVTIANDRYTSKPCATRTIRANDQIAAKGRICWTFFEFDPLAETDQDNDYGVWWIQGTFRPVDGWCIDEAEVHLGMGDGFPMSAMTFKDKTLKKTARFRVRLEATADGNTTVPAKVHNKLKGYAGRYFTTWSGTTFRARFKGDATTKKIALAGGIEGSWPADGGGPYIFESGGSASVTRPCRR